MARHLQARLPQGGDDIVPVPHRAVLDTLEQVVPDQVTWLGLKLEAGPQPRRLDVGAVPRLLHPGPCRVIGAAPPVFGVEGVAEWGERLLPARRCNVEAPAGLQVTPSGEDMDVSAAAALAVQHGRPGAAIGLQPRPSRLFEGIQNRVDLRVGWSVVGCPGDHARGVLVLEDQSVSHGGHLVGISPEDFDTFARLPGRIPLRPRPRPCRCWPNGSPEA